jgi:glycosyltransferase involved in cell wall biosynthesis
MNPPPATLPTADVTLLLEGTYPYVAGGVSAWVDQIIKGLPELKFALFFLGGQRSSTPKQHYALPPNVVTLKELYLHDPLPAAELVPAKLGSAVESMLRRELSAFYLTDSLAERARGFWRVCDALQRASPRVTFGNLCHDGWAWETLTEAYEQLAPSESFIDFFWTARFLHLPLWQLWCARDQVPPGRVYHSVSAGYSGLLAALTARQRKASCLLTEHGIYTKERIAEISQADWIYEGDSYYLNLFEGLGRLKRFWIGLFTLLGQISYDTADLVVTLFEGNAATQVEFGADRRKIEVIPNGIEPARLDGILEQVRARWQRLPERRTVGFIGRIVPIKDVKTLLRAARLVCERGPDIEFLLAGPGNEDPDYFDECRKIAELLGLESKVQFLGLQQLLDVLPRMDVLVLTSISEGLPLVILEAFAAGIPVVATDVGACRELVFGRTPEDRALGRAGRITKILSPQETADALLSLLKDPEVWRSASVAGRLRAERYYCMQTLIDSYRGLYDRYGRQHSRQAEEVAAAR